MIETKREGRERERMSGASTPLVSAETIVMWARQARGHLEIPLRGQTGERTKGVMGQEKGGA